MRYSEIVNESREAPLYHYVDYEKAIDIFSKDMMPGGWEHDIPGMGKVLGNSFTRNPRYNMHRPIRLVIDQEKLSYNYKIIPLDGEIIFRHGMNGKIDWSFADRKINAKRNVLAEEFVIGNIKNLHRYISSIDLGESGHISISYMMELFEKTKEYCDKFSIPLKTSASYVRRIEQHMEYMKYEDEE